MATSSRLNLGHNLFLSHSGADKDFVKELDELFRENSYNPFYDLRSLPISVQVSMIDILEEAKACQLALFVLSESFFIRTRNPMLELVACVRAGVPILPLFYKLSPRDLNDVVKRRSTTKSILWYSEWTKWEQEDLMNPAMAADPRKVDLESWMSALKFLTDTKGIIRGEDQSLLEYGRVVVQRVFELMEPDTRMELSNIQGWKRMCQLLDDEFVKAADQHSECDTATVVGVYGMGGSGKTTLCKSMLQFYYRQYNGKVLYVDLGSDSGEFKCLKSALKGLCGASIDVVKRLRNIEEGWSLWKQRAGRVELFLALDNVNNLLARDMARKYTKDVSFQRGSKILITARRFDLLPKGCILFPMPNLTQEEAGGLFLQNAAETSSEVPAEVLSRCQALIRSEEMYHPLVLRALGSWCLGGMVDAESQSEWVTDRLRKHFRESEEMEEFVFKVIRSSYDRLEQKEQLLFLDISLCLPEDLAMADVWSWLSLVYGEDKFKKTNQVKSLSQKAILNRWEVMSKEGCRGSDMVHDLYKDLARKIAGTSNEHLVYYREEAEVDTQLDSAKRLILRDCKFMSDTIQLPSLGGQVQILKIVLLQNHDEVNLIEIPSKEVGRSLRSIEIALQINTLFRQRTPCLINFTGLERASHLRWLSLDNCQLSTDSSNLSFPHLEVMNLRSCKLHNISLFNCTQLRSVKLLWNTVRCLSLSNCSSLEKLTMDQLGNSMIDLMMQCEEVQVPAPNQGLRHLLATFPANLYSGLCHYNFRTLRCLETFKINGLRDDSFRKLHISALDSQVNLEAIGPFNKMDTLKITADKFTTDWLKISRMQNLREIDFRIRSIENCRDNVLSLSQLTRLEVLSLSPYHGNFQGLSMCTSLQELYLEDCAGFHGDLDFSQLTNLKVLSLFGYQGECLHGLSMCTSLELLILSGCPSLKELTVPYECKTLKEVDLNDMMRMSSFPSLPLHTLPELRICNCPSIPVAEILRELSPNVACGESLLYILQNQYLPQQATEIGEYILASHNAQELIAHHEKNFSLDVFLAGSSN